MNKALLESLIAQNMSTRQIAEHLGKGQTAVRYWLKKFSLKTKPYKEKPMCLICENRCGKRTAKFCSNTCQNEYQYQTYIENWKNGLVDGNVSQGRSLRPSNHVIRYIKEKQGEACVECGWQKRHPKTGKVPITIDHIDGNPFNTTEDNLRVLCPSCHSLTESYGSLNIGNGRQSR